MVDIGKKLSARPVTEEGLLEFVNRELVPVVEKIRLALAGISSGSGDFVGPDGATDNAIVLFDGTTGKLGKDSGETISGILADADTAADAGDAATLAAALAADPIAGGAPANVTKAAASAGAAATWSRSDHKHDISTAAASSITSSTTNTEGSATTLARSDHTHLLSGTLDNNARVVVRKNSGADVGTRRRLNLIEGSNITLTVADDAGNEEVDVTIAASGGGGAAATTVEVNLGAVGSQHWRGRFTIVDAAIGATSKVMVWQAPGPYTGKGNRADEAELQPVHVRYVEPAAGSATVAWETPPVFAIEKVVPNGRRDSPSTAAGFDPRYPYVESASRRIGKVRGNVKFSYVVFS